MDNKAAATAPQDSIAGATTSPPANDTTGADTTGAGTTTGGNDEKRAGRALLWKGAQLGTSKVVYLLGTGGRSGASPSAVRSGYRQLSSRIRSIAA